MRKFLTVAAAVALSVMLAACGGSTGAASGDSGAAASRNAGAASGSAGAGAAQDAAKTDSSAKKSEKKSGEPADKFVFHTSEEVASFMETYTGKKHVKFGEPKWTLNGSPMRIEGILTPDKSAFTSVNAIYPIKTKESDISPEEILLDFYQDFCEKTGLSFEGAEEAIQTISESEGWNPLTDGSYSLSAGNSGGSYHIMINRKTAAVDSIPYTLDDARAFMEANAEVKSEEISRSVSDDPEILTGSEERDYEWSGSLDEDERLRSIRAEYHGDNTEEGKAFFTACTEYFLTGDVLEQGKKLLDQYDTIEAKKTVKAEMDKPYSMSLFHNANGYRLSISVRDDSVPSDAPAFPDAEKLAELQLDPIARLGVDQTPELPETVVFEQGDVKIIMEGSYYNAYPELRIKFRIEGAPEMASARVSLRKINGQEFDTSGWNASSLEEYLSADNPEEEMYLKLVELVERVPDFDGIHSIAVDIVYQADMGDPMNYVEVKDFTCGTNP